MSATGLFYAQVKDWIPLPAWARFLIELGFDASVTAAEMPDRRLVIALALPTRAYAASFCVTGVVVARSGMDDDRDQLIAHYERLSALPSGTALTYRKGNRTFPAQFVGTSTHFSGEPCLVVQTQDKKAGGMTEQVPLSRSMAVAIAEDQTRRLPKNPTGRQLQVQTEFVQRWLGGVDPLRFATKTQLDCVLVGNLRDSFAEIMQTTFGIRCGDRILKGTLQDIIRVKRFIRPGEGYRCKLIPVRDTGRPPAGDQCPLFVVFDGAQGFLRARDYWRDSNWIVLLDRTDPHFQEAADLLNAGYAMRPEGDDPAFMLNGFPRGAAILAYWEVR